MFPTNYLIFINLLFSEPQKILLSEDLLDLINNESERKRLSEEGPRYVKKYHDLSIISNKVYEYYDYFKNN